MAVFFVSLAGFKAAQAPKLALHRNADIMRHLRNARRDGNVVAVIGGSCAVLLERAVHHDAVEAEPDCASASLLIIAVVLMETDRNRWILRLKALNQLAQQQIAGIGARAAACLNNNGAIGLLGRL